MVSFWQEKCAVRTGNRLIREIEWRGSLSASVPSRAALPRFFLAAVFWRMGFQLVRWIRERGCDRRLNGFPRVTHDCVWSKLEDGDLKNSGDG